MMNCRVCNHETLRGSWLYECIMCERMHCVECRSKALPSPPYLCHLCEETDRETMLESFGVCVSKEQ